MIYVALGQLVVIAVLMYVLLREREAQAKVLAEFALQFAEERRELQNRIAQPGMIVPSPTVRHERPPPRDAAAYNAIGTVQKAKPDAA